MTEIKEGDWVEIRVKGRVRRAGVWSYDVEINDYDGEKVILNTIPESIVTKIRPNLTRGQVWENRDGNRWFVTVNAGNFKLVDEDGDRYDTDELLWEELSLRSDV